MVLRWPEGYVDPGCSVCRRVRGILSKRYSAHCLASARKAQKTTMATAFDWNSSPSAAPSSLDWPILSENGIRRACRALCSVLTAENSGWTRKTIGLAKWSSARATDSSANADRHDC